MLCNDRSSWTPLLTILSLIAVLPNVLAQSSTSVYQTRFENVTWNSDEWLLTTTDLSPGHYQSRMTVANGYHGIAVAALGPFFEVDSPPDTNGWPLFDKRQTFATISGFWDSQPTTNGTNFPWLSQYGWDSVISGIPHWGGIVIDLGGSDVLTASTNTSSISNFSSTLNAKQGLMNWNFTWTTNSHGVMDVSYQMFAHKLYVNQAFARLEVTPHTATNITFVNVLNGDCAVRTNFSAKGIDDMMAYTAVSPWGTPNITAFVYSDLSINGANLSASDSNWVADYVGSNQASIAIAYTVSAAAGQTICTTKFVGIASSDAFTDPRATARSAAAAAKQAGYERSLASHVAEWAAVFPESSVDDFSFPNNGTLPNDLYIIETAVTAVINPYYLLQNTISLNATRALSNISINVNSISVGGLGSDSYGGQIFWDADVWMHPGLVAAFPYAAQSIPNYRKKIYPQAIANAQTSYQSSKNMTTFSSNAAIYAWTSGRYGNCTATGPCWDYEYHLNGDIVLMLTSQWLASGDMGFMKDDLYPVTESVATMFSELVQRNGSYWALTNMTDPDEYANHVDNGGYTMPLIAQTLRSANILSEYFSTTENATWESQAQDVLIERDADANIVLEYTGPIPMNGSIAVKQADVVLIAFPLNYFNENYTASDGLSDLDYYANKQSPDGPGMTYAIFSIVANEVSPSGCSAYTYQQYSYQPYVRAPWFQFSEQIIDDPAQNGGTHPAFPFLTGHGGANQVILYGYLGLRYEKDGQLHVDPAPPPQLPNIRYRTFYWQGWPISAVSNQTHTTLSRDVDQNPSAGVTPNQAYSNTSIPVAVGPASSPEKQVVYQLSVNGSITVPNRQYWQNKTIANNIARCRSSVFSDSVYVPGQFPISAIDGALSTRWQPMYANMTSSMTVELPLGHVVTGFELDWSSQPPYNYSVTFHNDSSVASATAAVVASDSDVLISNPYNAAQALEIMPIGSNLSTVTLNASIQVYTARYATLSIWGNRYNGSLTAQNMSGQGATVAEWAVIVADSDGQSGSDEYDILKKRDSGGVRNKPEVGSRILRRWARLPKSF